MGSRVGGEVCSIVGSRVGGNVSLELGGWCVVEMGLGSVVETVWYTIVDENESSVSE